jgi:hypothetical protein
MTGKINHRVLPKRKIKQNNPDLLLNVGLYTYIVHKMKYIYIYIMNLSYVYISIICAYIYKLHRDLYVYIQTQVHTNAKISENTKT